MSWLHVSALTTLLAAAGVPPTRALLLRAEQPAVAVRPSMESISRNCPIATFHGARIRELYGVEDITNCLTPAEPGEIAAGVVVEERPSGELYLDTNPCTGRIVRFHSPYRTAGVGRQVTCNGHAFDKVQVEQR
jgi:hypothetical protein